MKTLRIFLISFFILVAMNAIQAQKVELVQEKIPVTENIEVYYFHFTKRCATCNAVESETKKALKKYYAEELEKGIIHFSSLNLDNKNSKKIADGLKLSGQSLLLVKGDKHVNLTSQGFMQARSNPEKFHEILKTKIDELL